MTRPRQQANPPPCDSIYINDRCIGCRLCTVLAPSFFGEDVSMELAADGAYIRQQPVTVAEQVVCREMMTLCPTNAIEENKNVIPNPFNH